MTILAPLLGLLATSACASAIRRQTDTSKFTYYDVPTPLAGPCDLSTGPDGAIWYDDLLVNKIGRIDPKTGAQQEWDIPYKNQLNLTAFLPGHDGGSALACVMLPGQDGNMYAASGLRNELVRIELPSYKITVHEAQPYDPLGNLIFLNDMWGAKDGMYFTSTTEDIISKFDYKTQVITSYKYPEPLSGPVGVFQPPNDETGVWTCEFLGQKIARFDTQAHTFKEYPVTPALLGPAVMRAYTNDSLIWFTAFTGNALGSIDISTGALKSYTNPVPLSFPTEDTNDGQGLIWFSSVSDNALQYLDPETGKFTVVDQPGTISAIPGIPPFLNVAVHWDKETNAIWFTDASTNKVGRYSLD